MLTALLLLATHRFHLRSYPHCSLQGPSSCEGAGARTRTSAHHGTVARPRPGLPAVVIHEERASDCR